MTLRFRYLGAIPHDLHAPRRVVLARFPGTPKTSSPDAVQLRWLLARLRQRTPSATEALREFVEAETAVYYAAGQCSQGQRSSDLTAVCDMIRQAVESGALLRAEFLPSFAQTLAWQLIKNRLRRTR